ncbi:Protein of unknown function [Bacillus cereus]|nr:Protein of unknown function [Bacillus cereus]
MVRECYAAVKRTELIMSTISAEHFG